MARVKETVWLWVCERCGHKWLPRDAEMEPKSWPNCKTPYSKQTKKAVKKKAALD